MSQGPTQPTNGINNNQGNPQQRTPPNGAAPPTRQQLPGASYTAQIRPTPHVGGLPADQWLYQIQTNPAFRAQALAAVKIEVAKRALALGLVDLLRRHFPGQSIASFIEIIIGITLLRAFIQGVWLHAQGR